MSYLIPMRNLLYINFLLYILHFTFYESLSNDFILDNIIIEVLKIMIMMYDKL